MKILYFVSNFSRPFYTVYTMFHMFDKFAEVKYYGPGFPGWRDEQVIDVPKVIEKLYPNDYPDIVITPGIFGTGNLSLFNRLKDTFPKAKCLRAIWIVDLHNDIMVPEMCEFLKNHGVDVILKSVDFYNETDYGRRLKEFGIPEIWYPFSIDPNIFYDRKLPRIYDVANIGSFSKSYYPIRTKAHEVLSRQTSIRYIGGRVEFHEGYPEVLSQSKILITDCSTFRWPIQKIFEAMACNTLVISNRPYSADVIGLQDRVNYVEINDFGPSYAGEDVDVDPNLFMEAIEYYLEHEEERLKIAQRGCELIHSRHTHDVRAIETLKQLEKYL